MKILFSVHKAGLVRTKQGCQLRNMINLLMPSELDHSLRKKKLMPMKQVYKVYITLSAAKENPNSGFLDLPMPLDNLMSLDDFPVPHIQDPQTKSCSCCGDPLDFLTTVEIFNSSGLPVLFGNVWALECGHLVDSQCAFLLLTHTAMRMFLPRRGRGQIAAMAHAVAKIWACPVSSCPAIYRSVLSRRTRGWTIAPGHSGQVEAMKPAYSHTPDGRPLSGLAELEELILKFGSLLQSLERWRGRNSRTLCLEFMTDW